MATIRYKITDVVRTPLYDSVFGKAYITISYVKTVKGVGIDGTPYTNQRKYFATGYVVDSRSYNGLTHETIPHLEFSVNCGSYYQKVNLLHDAETPKLYASLNRQLRSTKWNTLT